MTQELYDRLADEELAKRNAGSAAALRNVASMHPDRAATVVQLARETGLPPEVAERNQDAAQQMRKAREVADLASRSPILARQLGDRQFAAMAQDDLGTLGELENTLKAWKGPEPTVGSYLSGLAQSVPQGFRAASAGLSAQISDLFEATGLFAKDEVYTRERQRRLAKAAGEKAYTTPEFDTATARAIYGGLSSTLRAAPGIAMSVASRSPAPALAATGLQAEAEAYAKYRGRGGEAGESFIGAAGEGAVEVATEMLPMGFLVEKFGRAGMKEFAAGLLARELPSEQVATLLQDAIDTAVANPEKTWAQYLEERPGAAYETMVATLTQSAVLSGTSSAMRRLAGDSAKAQDAEQSAERLQAMAKMAEASKLKGRDSQTFRDLVAEIADEEGDAPTELYIAGEDLTRVLNQSGMSREELAAVAPVVAEQLDAAEAGAMVRVPVSEFLTAGEEMTAPLIDFMRTDPKAMSRAEATKAIEDETAEFESALERELGSVEKAAQFRDSISGMAAQFETGLVAAGRRAPVAKAEATLLANYYGTQAARSGVTLEEFARRYRLGFARGAAGGEQTLTQLPESTPETPAFKNWFGESKVVDAAGKPLVVYHGTNADFAAFDSRTTRDIGFHFGTAAQANKAAQFGATYPVFLSLKNPAETRDVFSRNESYVSIAGQLDQDLGLTGLQSDQLRAIGKKIDAKWSDDRDADNTAMPEFKRFWKLVRKLAIEEGFDGFGYKNEVEGEGRSFVAFRPEQIKSAIGNRGTYDPNDPNILNQANNASGESAASLEALSRIRDEMAKGQFRAKIGKDGTVTPLIGPTAVDQRARAGEVIVQKGVGKDRWTVLEAAPDVKGSGQARALAIAQRRFDAGVLEQTPIPGDALSLERNNQSVPLHSQVDSARVWKAKNLRNILEGASLAPEFDGIGELPELIRMQATMLSVARNDGKVFRAIVEAIPIDVVNNLAGSKRAAENLLRNDPMLKDAAAFDAELAISRLRDGSDTVALLMREAALVAAQFDGGSVGPRREAQEWLPALSADDRKSLSQDDTSPLARFVFGDDITKSTSVIELLEGATLSSVIHESGHLFLEIEADLAARIQQQISAGASVSESERGIVQDMGKLLTWFGIADSPGQTALDKWSMMSLDEKREHHEKFARGFEAYTREGRAPNIELQGLFSRFRSWLLEVYKKLRDLNVTLTDDVRAVMARMLASDEAIAEAQAQRDMGPLFRSSEQGGMTLEDYEKLQAQGAEATATAAATLDARTLADMKWMSRAKDKAIKARQMEVDDLRRAKRMEVRQEVFSEPVYRAWQFLTGKPLPGDAVATGEKPKAPESLLGAIARHGGLSQASAREHLGVGKDDSKGGLHSAFRVSGGLTADAMAERLMEDGYLTADANGKHDLRELEERLDAEIRGDKQFSIAHDYGPLFEGVEQLPEEVQFGKLSTPMLRDQYGTGENAVWRLLSARRMTNDAGIDPEVVAAKFGFDSGDALVQALATAVPPREVIEARTDARMLEEHGDITSPQALAQAADEAVFNEARARFVAAELKALRDAGKATEGKKTTAAVLAKAAKGYAQQIVARLRIRDLRPGSYAAASARSGRLSEKALGADKLDEAAMHKRNQLVNTYATKAAYEAQAEVVKSRAYFDRVTRSRSIDQEYQDQIDQLLEGFDFKAPTRKESARRASLSEWIAEQEAQEIPVAIDPALMATVGRKQYRDMTVEELRGLVETVKQIEHIGRLKKRLLNARDQRDLEAVAEEIKASIVKYGGKPIPQEYEEKKGLSTWAKDFWASHRKMSSFARQMDGSVDNGPMWTHFIRGMNEHVDAEVVMNAKAADALDKMYAPLYKLRGGLTGARSKVYVKPINASLTRAARMSVALNWGNADNRQRLMSTGIDGQWTEGQAQAVMGTLTAQELGVVNAIWTHLDTYWPQVADLQKRLTGTAPEKVEATPFMVMSSDGVEVPMRGGYYPIKYNRERSGKAEQRENAQIAKDATRGAFGRAMTRHGHTEARLAEVKEPLSLDLGVVTRHLHEVIHDLSWREWLIDSNKLLGEVGETMATHYGRPVLRQFHDAIAHIAVGELQALNATERAALLLRANVSRATMGLSFTTAFLQPFGLTQSMVRIGTKHVLRGAARWAGDAARMQRSMTWITEKSSFMQHRSDTFNRELREIGARVDGQSKAAEMRDAVLFYVMKKAQLIADVPTWIGQYEKTMDEGPKEDTDEGRAELEERAVAMADRAVREAQGSGYDADLAQIQRKGVVNKLLTQFYSYFNVTLNLAIEQTAATDFKSPRAVVGWVGDMALLAVIPAILPAMLMYAMRGGEDDDDWLKRLAKWQTSYLLGSVVGVRELTGAVEGFDYSGPPAARPIVNIGKAAQQTAQGDVDEPLIKAYANAIGTLLGVPMVQIMRSWNGYKAWDEGKEGAGPQSVLLGPPPKD